MTNTSRRLGGPWIVFVSVILSLTLSSTLSFSEVDKDLGEMTQGEFALFLVGLLDAEGLLPDAAVENDAIEFLEDLGIEPEDGWKADEPLTREDLVYMLGVEKAGELTIYELIEMLKERLSEMLWTRSGLRESVSPVIP